ncbi:U3 small nucleolar RNA-associated protein 25 homolog [Chrysoperla carnea]|uniref:U3 small nucleolar RNA-associated protein 25 homolog n=1 Tax=Chrysoperla carnea TaxID=189513 RepID=UPI001D0729B9|nr:U3 small nucleolar RNA-associated protein 25 homolog [Chrysoperla carnea]
MEDVEEGEDGENVEEDEDGENVEEEEGENNKSIESAENSKTETEEVIDGKELDEESEDQSVQSKDPFVQHFHYELNESFFESVQNSINVKQTELNWPTLGVLSVQIPEKPETLKKTALDDKTYANAGIVPNIIKFKKESQLTDLFIKSQISKNIRAANESNLENPSNESNNPFTNLQTELFSIFNNYQDCYYPERTFKNGEQIRFVYCLHAINHILKTRTKILHHNAKLSNKTEIPDEYRDQGLVRPKILIVVPFRNSVLQIVKMLISILVPEDKGQVINKLRFMDDFGGGELQMPKKNPKPEDYQQLFTGNTDDTFRIGLSITKKTLKLYTEFYSSDIIIASPLGLRMIVGAPGEQDRDFDFLASIEVLILDQAEQFLMQNWDHFLHVINHLHMQPKNSHGTDFSRVRMWSINGWAKYYRQSLIFSAYQTPEINSLFNKKCTNYWGKIKIQNPINKGTICKVIVQVPHVFSKFMVDNIQNSADARLEFFKNKVLPQYKESLMKNTLIYIPSYFDYVRVRNYFKQEELSFVQICEYSKEAKIARARDKFFHGEAHFMLYSERFHHFRRIRLKGIRHIIFYQPPSIPHFYSELCNFMVNSNQKRKLSLSDMTVSVVYCKYDVIYLNNIVGSDRATRMISSERNTYMFMTGE